MSGVKTNDDDKGDDNQIRGTEKGEWMTMRVMTTESVELGRGKE